jgi:hypothetical protein
MNDTEADGKYRGKHAAMEDNDIKPFPTSSSMVVAEKKNLTSEFFLFLVFFGVFDLVQL